MSSHASDPGWSPSAACAMLVRGVTPVASERVELAVAAGRVLAEPMVTDRPSPAMDYSAMDGYAMRVATAAPLMAVAGRVRIGREPPDLPGGATALTIVTGAPIPPGADAVIMREHVTELEGRIAIAPERLAELRVGQNIRRTGENAAAGSRVLEAGHMVTPPVMGVLAGVGATSVAVHRRVRVAVFSTGDELVDAAGLPSRWQVRDSNGPALRAFAASAGWVELAPGVGGHLPDDPAVMRRVIGAALEQADVIMLTGGVSMGDFDHVPRVLIELGATRLFHKVPQRPGRPIFAALGPGGQAILALPGNPVSVLVTARRYGLPTLRRLGGFNAPAPACPLVTLSNVDDRSIGLWWYRVVRLDPQRAGAAELVDLRGSGDLIAAGGADGFVEVPPGCVGAGPWPFYAWTS